MSNTSGTSSVLETARSAAAEAGLDPAKLAQDVGAKLKDAAESQKHAGAEKVLGVARAIRNAAGNIEQDSPEMARYVRSAASSIESFTRDFDDRSVDDLGQAVVDMARRSPGLFFAGSMLAGFALFRFLNAAQGGSSMRNQNWSSRRGSSMEGGAQRNLAAGSSQSAQRSAGQGASSSSSSSSTGGSGAGGSYGGTTPSSSGATSGAKSPSNAGAAAGSSGSMSSSSAGGYGGGGQGAAKPASSPSTTSPSQGRGQS